MQAKTTAIITVVSGAALIGAAVAFNFWAASQTPETTKVEYIPSRAEVVTGDINAPVRIIEYASLTCSHCGDFYNISYPVIKEKYVNTGKAVFIYRHLPIDAIAMVGASAVQCSPEEKRSEVVAELFRRQDELIETSKLPRQDIIPAIAKMASDVGVENDQDFLKCIESPLTEQTIADEMQYAIDTFGIRSTPTFIIGDQMIVGNVPISEIEEAISSASQK